MKRSWVLIVSTSCVVAAGCGVAGYEYRMNKTVENEKHKQKQNAYLQPAAEGKFKELSVYVRPPKPLVEGKSPLPAAPGLFDHVAFFYGVPEAAAPKGDPATAPPASGPLPPLRMHVLVRVKPKKATPKKGEAAPAVDPNAPAPATRGDFVADVRAVLTAEFGPEVANAPSPQNDKKKDNSFRRMIFTATSGDTVQVYFAEADKKETEVALVYDIPQPLMKLPIKTTGIELSLEAFAAGNKGRTIFNGGNAPAAGKPEAAGPAF